VCSCVSDQARRFLQLDAKIASAIKEAESACKDGAAAEDCATAWDEVEELSAAASHKKDAVSSLQLSVVECGTLCFVGNVNVIYLNLFALCCTRTS
jgi:hypothetical protein